MGNETLDILKTYRERLKSQYEKPGWNKWALFGALASLTWLLISLLSENEIETKDSIKLLIIIIFLENFVYQVYKFISNISKKSRTKYIRVDREISSKGKVLIFESICFIAIICYSKYITVFQYKTLSSLYYTFLFFNLGIYIIAPLISLIKIPFPQGKIKNKSGNWLKYLLLFMMYSLSIFSIYFLAHNIENWKIFSMWKSSFIFFGFYFVLIRIINTTEKNPLIDEIDILIDEVIFNNMNHQDAIKKLQLIIHGLEYKDAISPLLIEYFNLEKIIKEKLNYINEITLKLKEETDDIKKKALADAVKANFKSYQENEHAALTKFAKKTSRQLAVYSVFDHDQNEINTTIESLNASMSKFTLEIDKILATFNQSIESNGKI